MASPDRPETLQVHEDRAHERLEWRVQRIAWSVLALLLVAALSGGLGHGPLSDALARSDDGVVSVHHHRFERYQAPTQYDIRIAGAAARVTVLLPGDVLRHMELERFEPEPRATRAVGEGMLLVFDAAPGRDTGVRVFFRPERFGPLRADLRVQGRVVRLRQFVYP